MSAMASQITSLTIVYSTVYSGTDQRERTSKLRVTGLCAGNSPGTGEFPAQMASDAENVSIWWRHHVLPGQAIVIRNKFWATLFENIILLKHIHYHLRNTSVIKDVQLF